MTYGVTPQGFRAMTVEEILEDLQNDAREVFGPDVLLASATPMGQFLGIMASKMRELWELAEAVYSAFDPDKASGEALTALAALTGTIRNRATRSTVQVEIEVGPGTYGAGELVASVLGQPSVRFRNRDPITNATSETVVLQATFEAEETGPVAAPAGTLTVIATPVPGWVSVTNPADATLGRREERDSELRQRREDELTFAGGSSLEAIRVALARLPGMVSATLFENDSDATDSMGLPPHSFEAMVFDGTTDGSAISDETIGAALWDAKPAGIATYGNQSVVIQDSLGVDRTLHFSRPVVKEAFLIVELTADELKGWDPFQSPQLVKEALARWGDQNIVVGEPLRIASLYAPIFSVAGVVDVLSIKAGFAPNPTDSVNLPADIRDLIDLDTARITVQVV